jgi:hypothetical protein
MSVPDAARGSGRSERAGNLRPNRRRAFCRIARSARLPLSCLGEVVSVFGAACGNPNTSFIRRSEMSTLMKNKSLLLLPIGLAVLIAIGILTS